MSPTPVTYSKPLVLHTPHEPPLSPEPRPRSSPASETRNALRLFDGRARKSLSYNLATLLSVRNCIWLKAGELLAQPVVTPTQRVSFHGKVFLRLMVRAGSCPGPPETGLHLYFCFSSRGRGFHPMVASWPQVAAGMPASTSVFCRPGKEEGHRTNRVRCFPLS